MQATLERLRKRREEMGDEGGFTLIELLIVIVILGILAAIVVFAVQNLTGSSAQSACKSDFKTVETGIEAFNAQNGHYPTTTDLGVAAPVYAPPAGSGFTIPANTFVGALMTAQGNGTGATLRDFPGNGNHYQIAVTAGGKEQVYNPAGGATIPAANATGTAADCASVS
jgi:general secretion pathway protein G